MELATMIQMAAWFMMISILLHCVLLLCCLGAVYYIVKGIGIIKIER